MKLNQELSLGSKKKTIYPSKKRVNLVKQEGSRRTTLLEVALFFIFLVLLAIAAKFAVVDPLMSGASSSSELAQAQTQLDDLKAANATSAEVSEQYSRYVVANMTEAEQSLVNRDAIIDIIKTKAMQATYLSSVKVTANTLTITCLGVGLQEVSGLVHSLETDERVSHVTVSTAQSQDNKGSSATIEVMLKGPEVEASATGSATATKGATNGK